MERERLINRFGYYGIRFLLIDFLFLVFYGKAVASSIICLSCTICPITLTLDLRILPMIFIHAVVYIPTYLLLSYLAGYFIAIDRRIVVHANGMWCYTVDTIDETVTTKWISSEAVKPLVRAHCRLPIDLIQRIWCYSQKFEICRFHSPIWEILLDRVHDDEPLFLKAWPARIFGLRKMDDALWPHCSTMHVVALGMCDSCDRNDRLYVFRVSLLHPEKMRLLASVKMGDTLRPYTVSFGAMLSYQHDGLIFLHCDNTFITVNPPFPVFVYDLRKDSVIEFDTTIIGDRDLILILRSSAGRDEAGASTIRLAVFSYEMVQENRSAHCKFYCQEVEHERNEQRGEVVASVEYDLGNHRPAKPFPAGDSVVFPFERRRNHRSGRKFILYDTQNRAFDVVGSMQEFLVQKEEYSKFYERCRGMEHDEGVFSVPLCFLTEREALVARNSGVLWRMTFQPPTLKFRSLEAVLKFCGGEANKFNRNKWFDLTGLNFPGHFD